MFRQQVAVPLEMEHDSPSAIKPGWLQHYLWPTGRRGLLLVIVLVTALVVVAGTYWGKHALFTWFYPKVSNTWLYTSWHTVAIGRQAMQVSAPVPLRISDKALPADLSGIVEYTKTYRNHDGGGLQIEVNMLSYWQTVSNNLDDAATGAMEQLQLDADVTALQSVSRPVEQAGLPGIVQEGSFTYKNAIQLAFCNLVMVRGPHRWRVSIRYRADDSPGRQVAARILQSVQVK